METNNYKPKKGMNIREVVENASRIARATHTNIIVEMNGARFAVGPDTQIQTAIDAYLEVKNKMFETEQKLKQKTL